MANTGFGHSPPFITWLSWILSGDWMASLARLGAAVLVLLLFISFLACCIVPCTRKLAMSAVTTNHISGQYIVMGEASPPQPGVVFKYTCTYEPAYEPAVIHTYSDETETAGEPQDREVTI